MVNIVNCEQANTCPSRHCHTVSLKLNGWCVWPTGKQGHWCKDTGRHRYTLTGVQRLSCLDARILNKKFLVAKSLYLEGRAWLSICCHLSLHCPHSSVAKRRMQHCDQRQTLKQYGAGLSIIVLSMALVQGLCIRWGILVFDLTSWLLNLSSAEYLAI